MSELPEALQRARKQLRALEQAERTELEEAQASQNYELPVGVVVTTIDGKETKLEGVEDDPPISVFGETAFFDFGTDLIAVERVQSLSFFPLTQQESSEEPNGGVLFDAE